MDVESGNDTHPFRRFHQLNARIAHPANAAYRLDLIKHIKQDMRTICEESNQEWFITVSNSVYLSQIRASLRICYTFIAGWTSTINSW